MKVYFSNETEFNPVAMLTFGVSAKDQDGAIGYFGTGFKYAVAIILRLGGSIKIESHGKEYLFTRRCEKIRDQSFDVVDMNGQNAGFTTRLGINWEPWMAFRELYSNCLDEDGDITVEPTNHKTVITVDSTEVYAAFVNRGEYFSLDRPDYLGERADIKRSESSYVYYKGVAVYSFESNFKFNIKTHINLTEERIAAYSWQWSEAIAKEIQKMPDKKMIRDILTSDKNGDKQIPYSSRYETSPEFVSTVNELMKTDLGVPENARLTIKKMAEDAGDFPEIQITEVQKKMLSKASTFLKGIGVDVSEQPIKVVNGLGKNVMGRAINGEIYLSSIPFDHGTKQVASTLIEEWVHNKHGCKDFDRKMQSWLFDKILSIGEEIIGEPL